MVTSRALFFSLLSVGCVAAFLYYTIIPQGPHLLRWKQQPVEAKSGTSMDTSTGSSVVSTSETLSKVDKFTPDVLLSAPRRSAAIPNAAGVLAVYTVSTYSFESHKKNSEIRVLDIETGQSRLVTNEENARSPNWLAGNELLWLKSDKNTTKLVVGNVDEVGTSYVAGTLPAAISDVKIEAIDKERISIALVAKAKRDGSLYRLDEESKARSSAMLYDHLMVRHWDEYVTPNRNAIWHGILHKTRPHITTKEGRYSLGDLTNVLKGSRLESPIPTFGGLDNFDLGSKGICFVAKDPDLDPAFNTKSNFYFVGIEMTENQPKYSAPVKYEVEGLEGASTSPVFSPDGESAAFLQMKENGYESDKNRVLLLDVGEPDDVIELMETFNGRGLWDRSPGSVSFSNDARTLYLTAEETGRVKLFKLSLPDNPRHLAVLPELLSETGSVSDVRGLSADSPKLFLSGTSLVDNSVYSIVDPRGESEAQLVSSISRNGTFFGLSQDQVSETWFEGAGDYKVHAWVIKPSNFEPDRKYPLAYLIHGGPQGSWDDSWSTRWNPAVFAEQGYVVVAPNPTGSTGYGQAFTDDIAGEWGGRPYQDLVRGFEHIKANMSFVDSDRAVALGASYGGYMMAWMQGHDLGKEFKALVCHDGSFNLPAQLASDEHYFPNHDLGGPPTTDPSAWDKWSPSAYISNWTTPMLVIHNELDYRLPIGEGLAMFNVLQERGVKSRFLTFPDENHWVLKEENSLVWHTVVLNWINGFVGLPEYKSEEELGIVVQN
ncbi:MAG: hypothetical protein Q9163_000561 [Psora crenata]